MDSTGVPIVFEYQESPQVDNWKHKSIGMKCGNCMWFVEKEKMIPVKEGFVDRLGRCRKHSPSLSGWPAVFNTDWCGDHKLSEESI